MKIISIVLIDIFLYTNFYIYFFFVSYLFNLHICYKWNRSVSNFVSAYDCVYKVTFKYSIIFDTYQNYIIGNLSIQYYAKK